MKRLNRNHLKYLAITAMVVDHVAWAFVPTVSLLGQLMHLFGRLTGPLMAFFLAEGYAHTRDVKKYALRLGLFALLSWVPFSLFETWRPFYPLFGVIYTLFLGLLAVWLWDKAKLPVWVKALAVAALCFLSRWGDWSTFDVLWPLAFFLFRDDEKKKWTAYCLISLLILQYILGLTPWWRGIFQLGVFLVPLLVHFCYNGESGSKAPFHKWFFYVFYPAHLLVLYALKLLYYSGY